MVGRTKILLLAGASALAILVGAADADAETFNVPGSYEFTVPVTGEYVITAVGGSGGNSRRETGGLGAGVRGDIVLTAGENLYLFVAQQGYSGAVGYGSGGGGGGGSFVFASGGSLRAAAGGGGGAGYTVNGGGNGQAGTNGQAGYGSFGGSGGVNGSGGQGGTYVSSAAPFVGFGGNGGGGTGVLGLGGNGAGAQSAQGGIGPIGGFGYAYGGFGGGGGGGYNGGGGGGGFSGGGGGGGNYMEEGFTGYGGGGGGSYLSFLFTKQILASGTNYGDGYISIVPVPEPSTWAMMLAGFAGLGGLVLRRKRKIAPA